MKGDPVPEDGLPPVAVQLKVTGGVPPEAVAVHETTAPTVPVLGQLMVTTKIPPTVAVKVALTPLKSVTFSLTEKGPELE